MSKIQTVLRLLKEDRNELLASIIIAFFKWLPDTLYLKLVYQYRMGCKLNLKEPKTFTEKIQWLKLYNRRQEYSTMVDKFAVKKYVADLIGTEYIIPTLGVWNSVDFIDWDSLPDQFVLKTTHGGGNTGVVICKDKASFDRKAAIEKLKASLSSDIYLRLREWPYKNVSKRIIAEKFMTSKNNNAYNDLTDYKFFCFNGEPKYCQVIRDRNTKETIDFYDSNWQHMEFVGLNPVASNGLTPVARPVLLDKMQNICRVLAKNIPFVRVDLYDIDDRLYFGELTFYPATGIGKFSPEEWNNKLGDLINLAALK